VAVNGAFGATYFSNLPGVIGGSFTFTTSQTFGSPQSILAFALLSRNTESDDQTETVASIFQFIDNGVPHSGTFPVIFASKCTKIIWSLFCDHSFNNPTRLILFF
jgi:hypothetical protein